MRTFYILGLLILFPFCCLAQDSLSTPLKTSNKSNNTPKNLQLSHIEIQEQFIDFKRLNDSNYRQQLTFGEALSQSFDSVVAYYNYPLNLNLPHYLNTLTFHFTAIDWKTPHKIEYNYYLEGFEKEWNIPSPIANATYRDLRHGNYILHIKARGENREWSNPFIYSFSIRTPWWQSWWAYLGYTLFLAIFGVLVFKLIQQRKRETEKFERLLEENKLLAFSNKVRKKPVSKEGDFLNLVHQTLEAHLSDENFGIAELCEILKISRTQLHRKLKKLTGQSTSHYIRSLRLDIAKGLLEKTQLNISEVAFTVGFSSATYFSKVFKKEFGYTPKDFR